MPLVKKVQRQSFVGDSCFRGRDLLVSSVGVVLIRCLLAISLFTLSSYQQSFTRDVWNYRKSLAATHHHAFRAQYNPGALVLGGVHPVCAAVIDDGGGQQPARLRLDTGGVMQDLTGSTETVHRLSTSQYRMCQLYPDHMTSVGRGARMAIDECQHQLRWRRWNCSSFAEDNSLSGTSVDAAANRETALVQALASAGVMHAVSRACRDGELTNCACSSNNQPPDPDEDDFDASPDETREHIEPLPASLPLSSLSSATPRRVGRSLAQAGDRHRLHSEAATDVDRTEQDGWQWGGCGDNADYGYTFSIGFIDARYKEKNFPRHSTGLARMLAALHNNEVGRLAVYNYATVACKCHGVSGSCTIKSCFHQLPAFRDVGSRLLAKYDAAISTAFNRHGTALVTSSIPASTVRRRSSTNDEDSRGQPRRKWKRGDTGRRPSKEDLIYFERSPDYCETTGDSGRSSANGGGGGGTHGRQCRRPATSTTRTTGIPGRLSLASVTESAAAGMPGPDSCDVLCCGRGYNSYRETVVERCRCRFVWCCHVTCSTCEREENVHVCK